MATYEYVCLSCEHRFEERRPMTSAVDTALNCPSCGSDRVRRQFSVFSSTGTTTGGTPGPSSGGCCGGGCACGG